MAIKKKIEMKQLPKGNSNNVEKLIQGITNRYRVTAREARDIVTAVGTLATGTKRNVTQGDLYSDKYTPVKNLAKQIKEVVPAAVIGKKGTSSTQITPGLITPGGNRNVTRQVGKATPLKKTLADYKKMNK